MQFIINLLINGFLIYVVSALMDGVVVSSFWEAVAVAFLLAIANTFIRPILTILTLPITILTLGLFLLVINGAMVLLVDGLLSGFYVDGWLSAIIFALILAFFNLFVGGYSVQTQSNNR